MILRRQVMLTLGKSVPVLSVRSIAAATKSSDIEVEHLLVADGALGNRSMWDHGITGPGFSQSPVDLVVADLRRKGFALYLPDDPSHKLADMICAKGTNAIARLFVRALLPEEYRLFKAARYHGICCPGDCIAFVTPAGRLHYESAESLIPQGP